MNRVSATLAVLLAFAALAGAAGPAAAAQSPRQSPEAEARGLAQQANAGTVGVISGGVDGTYVRIAADLASVLDDGTHLRVLPVIGKGSLQNLSDILFLHGIDIGIVQSDVLEYAKRAHLFPGVAQDVQYISKLYDEEVHVLARRDIAALKDLAGQKVNVDVAGSGTAMTAGLLFNTLGVAVQPVNEDQGTALERLKRGEIAALVYVTGQPARLFAGIGAESGLHFLSVPATPALMETYLPATLDHKDYPALIPQGQGVETLAVGSVMAVYNWQPGTDRFRKVAAFTRAFFEKFPRFLQPQRHPKWKEVNLAAQVPGWTRFSPAQDMLASQVAAGSAGGPVQQEFEAFLTSTHGSALPMAERRQLFQEFLEWEQSRNRVTPVGAPVGADRIGWRSARPARAARPVE